jgi:hypothetical protein
MAGRHPNQDSYMGPGMLPGGLPLDQGREPPTSHVRASFVHKEITFDHPCSGTNRL